MTSSSLSTSARNSGLQSTGLSTRYHSIWVPLSGKKRKAPDEPDTHMYSHDTAEPPPKQFAIDEEIASTIIKDGYIIEDDSDASNDGMPVDSDKLVQLVDVGVEDAFDDNDSDNPFTVPREPGKKAKRRLNGPGGDDVMVPDRFGSGSGYPSTAEAGDMEC